jgi:methyl-accepting chemotaxis protein
MTIKLKIVAAMAAALLVALIVGGISLQSLQRIHEDVRGLYYNGLVPVVTVSDIRTLVFKSRSTINSALLKGNADAAKDAGQAIGNNVHAIDQLWATYYPAQVGSPEEMTAAKQFLADRTQTRTLITHELALIAAGQRAQATDFMLQTLAPSFDKEAASIETIVTINQKQGQGEYEDATARQHTAVVTNSIVLLIGAVIVLFAGMALTRAVMRPLLRARHLAERISQGELNHALQITGRDELSDTLRSLSTMDAQLTAIVGGVRDNASQVARATQDISAGNDSLSQRTQEQASSLEETAASMEEMTATVKQNADGANQAQSIASSLRKDAAKGHQVATDAVAAMRHITDASQNISEIAVLIDEIAFQTNLLALNAAVEAARAGEQGRGFTVVAGEVRSLAQRSAKAAKDIKALITDSAERVVAGAELVRQTGDSLEHIQKGAMRVSDIISEIAAASVQQSAGIDQVNDAVTLLDQVTQENAALVEEASAASRHTMELAQDLMTKVAFFKVLEHDQALRTEAVAAVRSPGRQGLNAPRLAAGAMT